MPRLHVVFGAYDGPIHHQPGEKVLFIGDCASWEGNLDGELVQIRNIYKDRDTRDPHEAKHDDILKKLATTTRRMAASRSKTHLRLEGCPVSVAEQVLALVGISGAKNPYLDPAQIVSFNRGYLGWRARVALNRVLGQRYQKQGSFRERGQAAPEVTSSP